jgi:hypothetical protein
MVGRASALLILGGTLAFYYVFHDRLWDESDWWDVAFVGLALIPACFALVLLLLPLRIERGLPVAVIVFGVLAVVFNLVGWHTPENFSKLFGVTALGFWFLRYFESVAWVVLVAMLIPLVDAYSVWRGPTREITEHHEDVFTTFSFAFPIPGERASANLGLPDLLFFSLFLAAAARFALRPGLTWVLLTLSFGATMAFVVGFDRGLPALPLLSLGFLAANADLLWARLRSERADARR